MADTKKGKKWVKRGHPAAKARQAIPKADSGPAGKSNGPKGTAAKKKSPLYDRKS